MAYQISYDNGSTRKKNKVKIPDKRKILFRFVIVVIICTAGVFLLNNGKERIWDYIIPGDPQITENALSDMAAEIKNGGSVREAIASFCREIISNAGITK